MLFYESIFSSLHIYVLLKIHPKYIHTELFHVSCTRSDSQRSFQRVSDEESLSSLPVGILQILEGCYQVSVQADLKMLQK